MRPLKVTIEEIDFVYDGVPAIAVPFNATQKEGPRMATTMTKNLGMLLLGVWLILSGLLPLLNLSFSGVGIIMGVLAIAAGVLILIGR